MDKLIITAALTGAELTRTQQPALPTTPEEIAQAAWECAQAGAAIVHVHARRADGSSTQEAAAYRSIIEAVRARCDVIVQVSTGGAVGMTAQERIAPLALRPEMATLTMGSVNFGDGVFLNPPPDIERFLHTMRSHGVVPEFEVFDAGMLAALARWVAKRVVAAPGHVDFVLGVPGGMPGTPEALMYLRSQLPAGFSWSVAGIGAAQLPMTTLAIVLGGHVRVGFEDNILLRRGELAGSNAQFVQRAAAMARLLDRPLATPDEARSMLGLRAVRG
ncbi:MAG: 3-keto-5-aminohexanoate cleavage protein [Rubrivivax sp.]|nr:3-keto-5-aminohexanoate cleavage protein [Rubrivivax sp.]